MIRAIKNIAYTQHGMKREQGILFAILIFYQRIFGLRNLDQNGLKTDTIRWLSFLIGGIMIFKHDTSIVESEDIGDGTKIWAFTHICKGVKIGSNCIIGEHVYIGPNVFIGNNVKIQNGALIYEGLTIEDDVFIGPGVCTTNDIMPKSQGDWTDRFRKTLIKQGASVGANATIICGVVIGENSMIGAGSVVAKNVKPNKIVKGVPAK